MTWRPGDRAEAAIELANRAWDDFEFPDDIDIADIADIADAQRWEYVLPLTGSAPITRVFHVEDENPGMNSLKCQFSVIVDTEAMALKDVYVTDPQGNDFGVPGPVPAPAP